MLLLVVVHAGHLLLLREASEDQTNNSSSSSFFCHTQEKNNNGKVEQSTGIMPAIDGHRMFTFEDGERESEYGYVRKVSMYVDP
jgi:hypothetical protein